MLDLVILFTLLEFYNTPFYITVLYPKTTLLMKNHLSMQTTLNFSILYVGVHICVHAQRPKDMPGVCPIILHLILSSLP